MRSSTCLLHLNYLKTQNVSRVSQQIHQLASTLDLLSDYLIACLLLYLFLGLSFSFPRIWSFIYHRTRISQIGWDFQRSSSLVPCPEQVSDPVTSGPHQIANTSKDRHSPHLSGQQYLTILTVNFPFIADQNFSSFADCLLSRVVWLCLIYILWYNGRQK